MEICRLNVEIYRFAKEIYKSVEIHGLLILFLAGLEGYNWRMGKIGFIGLDVVLCMFVLRHSFFWGRVGEAGLGKRDDTRDYNFEYII